MTDNGAAIYDVENAPYYEIYNIPAQKRRAGNPGTRKTKYEYKDILCAFDIETSAIPEINQSVMYVWQFHLEGIGTVIGRTWNEFLHFLDLLGRCLKPREKYLIYVHNLSYEFQFLRGIYSFTSDEVFAVKARKILKCEMFGRFEFRCSYLQSNMSLANFTRNMGVSHEKISGFDYNKRRYFDTPLSEFEQRYIVHDVRGLVEAMRKRIEYSGDSFYTVPFTSTGYCRRDAKHIFRECVPYYVRSKLLPSWEIYTYLRRAFRGGNTHASRFYSNLIIKNVKSVDKSSAYPDALVNKRYPMSEFFELENPTPELLRRYMDLLERACLVEVEFTGLRLKHYYSDGCPYLAIGKCDCSRDREDDNGRILSASYCLTVLTDVDFRIVEKQYTWETLVIRRMFHARYGYLPLSYRDLIKKYYRNKTELKGVAGREDDYRHSKELINSLYGMSAQDPARVSILFQDDDFIDDDSMTGPERLAKYYRTAFMPYSWGVWCTAWARYELQEMINIAGRGFIYCDTDSVKYVGDADFSAYNDRCMAASQRSGAYAADPSGEVHYMGVAESEGTYAEFKTMGAKKYAWRDGSGKIGITIAGVSKAAGAEELEAVGGLEAMQEGFTFRAGGGQEAIYNDKPEMSYWTRPDGVQIPITANVYLAESTYTLGLAAEYRRLLEYISLDMPIV